ncbi:hypothetical protein PDG61_20980 [Mycolicibacterium sp. BiH015]|uniref:hypothetical protein n=1 Tax=Mycolicibacterium sp. BiH015 TaxID=3018808 RepID=UPI0022E3E5E0|nr:hypothetical protein [Mycolicibacterium sp. BiH015]MDA2893402.1 hypothetical protein [Mycolicibacterium sp. BiH015]
MSNEVIGVNKGGVADWQQGVSLCCAELDNAMNSANNTLAGIAEFFSTEQGAPAFANVHNLLMQGIEEGKETLIRHGNTVGDSVDNFVGTDIASMNAFNSI